MVLSLKDKTDIQHIIINAIREDIGDGDHSSFSCIPADAQGKARLLVKDTGILAGVCIVPLILDCIDKDILFHPFLHDGQAIQPQQVAFELEGNIRGILLAERLILNIMQRMSGIATCTYQMVQKIQHTSAKLLDTRKTTPNFRILEKLAVKIGGGHNHRFGLYDMIMLKDNHVDFAGSIPLAISRAHDYLNSIQKTLPIEIETRNLEEVKQVLAVGGVNRIMLDNFTPQAVAEAVELIKNDRTVYETEASGGITEDTIVAYAETGVDFISMGALTRNITTLDLSLKQMS